MALLLHHHMSIFLLLLLAALAVSPAAATDAAADTPVKKIEMRFRQANKEEAQWLDRYAETHQPLGAGPLSMVRATDRPSESHDSEEGESGGGGGSIDFDADNPYVQAMRDWVSRLTKQSMDMDNAQGENPFKDL